MKDWGLYNNKKKLSISLKNIMFFITLLFFYSFFSLSSQITTILLEKEPIDVFTQDMQRFAMYSRTVNKDLGNFIFNINDIIQDYQNGYNAFETQREKIDKARGYLAKNHNQIENRGFDRYEKLFQIMADLYIHKDEIYNLFGDQNMMNYLAVLQNVAEKRPNGGFFGSFAFASIHDAQVKELGVVDTYFPNHIAPYTYIKAPNRSVDYLGSPNIGFVAANKFGFSDQDGKNIKDLFETIFNEDYNIDIWNKSAYSPLQKTLLHKYIKGVIFLRTDMFENIIPGFNKKIRERQFVNASIDLIRGESRSHKKEVYLKEVNEYFFNNQLDLVKAVINNFDTISDKNLINLYISNISPSIESILEQYNLTNRYNSKKIYAWDTNNAFNKIDRFITKEIFVSKQGVPILHRINEDIINVQNRESGIYTMELLYHLNIDPEYIKFIKQLEKKYEIELSERELGILGLGKSVNEIMRGTKSIIHFPTDRIINYPQGDTLESDIIITDFSQAATYKSEMQEANQTNIINIQFEIP